MNMNTSAFLLSDLSDGSRKECSQKVNSWLSEHEFEFSVKYFLFYYLNSFIAELCHKMWLIVIVNWNWIRTFFVLHFIISINTRISPIECRTFFSLESYWVAIQIQPFTEKNTCVTEKNSGKWAQICSAERVSMKVLTK